MAEGLVMDENDFNKLKSVDRDTLIYKNVLNQNVRISKIEKKVDKLSVAKLIGGLWLLILTTAVGLKKYIPFL